MKINQYKDETLAQDYVDIYYKMYTKKIDRLISYIDAEEALKIRVKSEGMDAYIFVTDVYYFESIDRRYVANQHSESNQVDMSLKEIEDMYENLGFVRINKSMVLNLNTIEKIGMDLNMRMLAHLRNGEVVQINRSYKKIFNKKLLEYVEKTTG